MKRARTKIQEAGDHKPTHSPASSPHRRVPHNHRYQSRRVLLLLGLLLGLNPLSSTKGLVFLSTGDPNYNTTPPTGRLEGSGWQYVGFWGPFIGTPIAPYHFITAKHVRGSVGTKFYFHGVEYKTVASYASPNSDLRIYKVDKRFPIYAPLYTRKNEKGKEVVVMGRGGPRGSELRNAKGEVKGWNWAGRDGRVRWGQNKITDVYRHNKSLGDLMKMTFDRGEGPNECHCSSGDSGGPVFIKDGSVWKLAGINYATDGLFSPTGEQGSFRWAAVFDQGGLWVGDDMNRAYQGDWSHDVPSAFYATRISSNLDWIASKIPELRTSLGLSGLESPGNPVGPRDLTIRQAQNGDWMIEFTGEPGRVYTVWTSEQLIGSPWRKLMDVSQEPGEEASGVFQVLVPSGASSGFFKVLEAESAEQLETGSSTGTKR